MIILLKAICISNSISIKIPIISFAEIAKNSKIYVKAQKTQITRRILNRKRHPDDIIIPDTSWYTEL